MKKIFVIICLFGISPIFNACISHRVIDDYPAFNKERLLIDSVSVLTDVVLFNSDMSDYAVIEDSLFVEIRDSVSLFVSERLAEKGYSQGKIYEPNLFCLHNSKMKMREGIIPKEKPSGRRNRRIGNRTKGNKKLYVFLDSVPKNSPFIEIFPNHLIPIDTTLRTTDFGGIDVLAMVSVKGTNISAGEEAFIAVASGLTFVAFGLVGGLMASYPETTLDIRIWLVDRKTRQIMWRDRRIEKVDPTNFDNLIQNLEPMLKDIPNKSKQ